ncbi:MAG: YHS domain-containing (seleno)protein [Bacteroidota bacterium]|nr:YHS domain-containing (seleno)protein [Bacteroidota bacterium]
MYLKIIIISLSVSINVFSQELLRSKHFNISNQIAISGYDPISYFKGSPKKGKKEFQYKHEGIVYNFVDATNQSSFKSNPAKYEPAYGGWCAYAMGNTGEKVEVDPETFKIIDGKLYLFYNQFFNNTLKDWNKDESNLKKKADINWTNIFK